MIRILYHGSLFGPFTAPKTHHDICYALNIPSKLCPTLQPLQVRKGPTSRSKSREGHGELKRNGKDSVQLEGNTEDCLCNGDDVVAEGVYKMLTKQPSLSKPGRNKEKEKDRFGSQDDGRSRGRAFSSSRNLDYNEATPTTSQESLALQQDVSSSQESMDRSAHNISATAARALHERSEDSDSASTRSSSSKREDSERSRKGRPRSLTATVKLQPPHDSLDSLDSRADTSLESLNDAKYPEIQESTLISGESLVTTSMQSLGTTSTGSNIYSIDKLDETSPRESVESLLDKSTESLESRKFSQGHSHQIRANLLEKKNGFKLDCKNYAKMTATRSMDAASGRSRSHSLELTLKQTPPFKPHGLKSSPSSSSTSSESASHASSRSSSVKRHRNTSPGKEDDSSSTASSSNIDTFRDEWMARFKKGEIGQRRHHGGRREGSQGQSPRRTSRSVPRSGGRPALITLVEGSSGEEDCRHRNFEEFSRRKDGLPDLPRKPLTEEEMESDREERISSRGQRSNHPYRDTLNGEKSLSRKLERQRHSQRQDDRFIEEDDDDMSHIESDTEFSDRFRHYRKHEEKPFKSSAPQTSRKSVSFAFPKRLGRRITP
ncbi:hypothetical protein BC829DRAFT_198776 [Chytridium lagenaria]|nr:hypothetical protein BC829DRAFT_198776 [Chytridium lagenaria]